MTEEQLTIESLPALETKSDLELAFELWDHRNPIIYQRFEQLALKDIRSGRRHLSAKFLTEVIRHNYDDETTTQSEVKIPNAHTPYLARKFERLNPRYRGYFKCQRVRR